MFIYKIKLRSSFQAILLSLMSDRDVILCFTDTNIEYFLLINDLSLIYNCYLYNARVLQNLSFLAFQNIKIKTLEESTREERKFLKKWQIINTVLSG